MQENEVERGAIAAVMLLTSIFMAAIYAWFQLANSLGVVKALLALVRGQ